MPVLQVVTFGGVLRSAARHHGDGRTACAASGPATSHSQSVSKPRTLALKQELQALQIRSRRSARAAQRTDSLRQLLELRERAPLDTTGAEVIAGAASPEFRTVTIDKGTSTVSRPTWR